jgi:hypothetical protein
MLPQTPTRSGQADTGPPSQAQREGGVGGGGGGKQQQSTPGIVTTITRPNQEALCFSVSYTHKHKGAAPARATTTAAHAFPHTLARKLRQNTSRRWDALRTERTSRDTSRMTEKMGKRMTPGTLVMAREPSLMTRMATAMERRRATMMHTMMMVMAVKMYAAMRNLSCITNAGAGAGARAEESWQSERQHNIAFTRRPTPHPPTYDSTNCSPHTCWLVLLLRASDTMATELGFRMPAGEEK